MYEELKSDATDMKGFCPTCLVRITHPRGQLSDFALSKIKKLIARILLLVDPPAIACQALLVLPQMRAPNGPPLPLAQQLRWRQQPNLFLFISYHLLDWRLTVFDVRMEVYASSFEVLVYGPSMVL
jgi:hypothetical protein